jgi:hypothetical protein
MNLHQMLVFMLVIFILTIHFISSPADVYLKQLSQKYLVGPIFADQGWSKNSYYSSSTGYMLISTEQDEKDDTEDICNKLLETCKPTNQTNIPATNADNKESDKVAEKYFEDGANTPKEVIAPSSGLNVSEPALIEKNETASTQDLQVYENPTLGVKILYPMGWDNTENQTNRYTLVSFISHQQTGEGTVQEKFLLRVNNELTDMSLDDYTKRVNENMQKNGDFQVTGTNSTELANNPASSVTGILKEGDKHLKVLDEWTINNGKVYRIVFYSDPEKNDSFQPLVQKILDSFSITK